MLDEAEVCALAADESVGERSGPAECVLLSSGADYHSWRSLMERSAAEAEADGLLDARTDLGPAIQRLGEVWGLAGGTTCRHRSLVEYFGQPWTRESCGAGVMPVAWRAAWLAALFTGRPPVLTRDLARNTQSVHHYDTSKLRLALPDFRFTSIREVIRQATARGLT